MDQVVAGFHLPLSVRAYSELLQLQSLIGEDTLESHANDKWIPIDVTFQT
jgi:hypothetical protein